jgi:hypothetical protein
VEVLVQLTYSGASNNLNLDNSDIRFADNVPLGGKTLIFGVMVNNNATAQDVWHTTPAWSYLYASHAIANIPAARALIDGGLGQ